MRNTNTDNGGPWWRFGYVWLVLSGPAVVVVASLVTFYVAITKPDPVVTEDYYRKGLEFNKNLRSDAEAASFAPAIQARNHAQTGVLPVRNNVKP